jgi:Tfp pilus assembly protein PilO
MAGGDVMKIRYLDRLGNPGIVGLGMLVFALSFYLGSLAPARDELAALQAEQERLLAARSAAPSATEPAGALAMRAAIPALDEFPELLKALNALAEMRGVTLDRASYALSEQDGQRRMEISLPLLAGYPALRAYLRDLPDLKGSPSLDELTLKIQQASDPVVEATLRLTYIFAAAP